MRWFFIFALSLMNKKAFLVVAVALLIPLICYFIVKQASETAIDIPRHYLPDSVSSHVEDGKMVSDTFWHKAANFSLVNQLGDTVHLYDIKGKMIVMDYFFTSCMSICPQLTKNMSGLQQSFLKGGDLYDAPDSSIVQFISFSVDPQTDSVQKLKRYADRFGVVHDNWWMLTGNRDSIYDYAFNELKVDKFSDTPVDTNFVHTSRFVLLDKNYNIRGYYNGLDTTSIHQLAQDIGILMLSKDDNPEGLPFDPAQMAIFFAIALVLTIIAVRLIFRKQKPKSNVPATGA